LLVILAGALMPSSVRGSDMTFSKDDVGQLWLQIIGRIDDGDDAKLKSMLIDAINRGDQIVNVSIYSPGGRAPSAMRIGRYIRALHLTTVAPQLVPLLGQQTCRIYTMSGRATVLDYDPWRHRGDPRCTCAGECFLIWAAGAARVGDAVQIHRISLSREDFEGLSDAQGADVEAIGQMVIAEYLREAGIPAATIDRISRISPDRVEHLTRDERDALEYKPGLPWAEGPFRARCRQHTATSPAALACEKAVARELYWEGARRLLSGHD